MTLDGYDGGEIYAEKSLAIVVTTGSNNKVTSANGNAITSKGALVIGGSGFLEVNGAGGSFDSAIYSATGVTISYTNLVAKAGGYGVQCYNGAVVITDARVLASGSQYTIFSALDMTIGTGKYLEQDFSSSGVYFNNGSTLIKNGGVSNEAVPSLKIDGASVNASENASGNGWFWIAELLYLNLNGYDGGFIYCDGNLDIELAGESVNKVTNLAALTEKVNNLTTYCGIVATQQLQVYGDAELSIEVNGKTVDDIAYGVYSYSDMIIQGVKLTIDTSYKGIFSNSGTLWLQDLTMDIETLGDSITAYGDITITDSSTTVLSYMIGIYSKLARIIFDGGDASVYGENRSAIANLNLIVGEDTFATGTLIDSTNSVLYSAFNIDDGIFTSTYEKAIFKINGVYYDFEGDTIDRLDTEGWKFDFDTTNSKYVLQLKNYNGGTIIFSLNLEVQLLDDSTNTISYADNTTLGGMFSCFDIGGSLTIVGNGKLIFVGSGPLGGIGIYTDGNCTINGDTLEIDASGVARGMAIQKSLTIRACDYEGSYITADKVYINGGNITIDSSNGTNCFLVDTLFQISGGNVILVTHADGIELSCVKSYGEVAIIGGSLNANAIGAYGSAINATGRIKLLSERIECAGEGRAVYSETGGIVFGDSVLVFAGVSFDNVIKTRVLTDADKFVRTQEFILELSALLFDNDDVIVASGDLSIDLGMNFDYFEGLRYNGRTLIMGVDYTTEGNFVILSNLFLTSLANGVQRIELDFGGGFYKTLSITVENSNVVPQIIAEHDYVGVIVVDSIALLLIAVFIWSVISEEKKKSKKE